MNAKIKEIFDMCRHGNHKETKTERKTGHGYGGFAGKISRSYCKKNKC